MAAPNARLQRTRLRLPLSRKPLGGFAVGYYEFPNERQDEMFVIRGLYEVAIRVKDLAKSEKFYRETLGLEIGARDERRKWLFLRAGGEAGMVVLQEDKGTWPTQHFAFTLTEADIGAAAADLQGQGVAVQEPVYHEWMPAKSLYFSDPDGHELELCAPVRKG